MGLEEKRDNKSANNMDSKSNGRPVSFSLGDGNDFSIDLPTNLPGEEDIETSNLDSEEMEELTGDLDKTTKKLQDALKEMGVDDIHQFLKDNE